ncbi:MAG: hypothetical protein WEA56_12810 [Balneolaceae bacterium]
MVVLKIENFKFELMENLTDLNLTSLSGKEIRDTDGGLILAWLAYKALKGAYEKGYDDAQEKCTCQSE